MKASERSFVLRNRSVDREHHSVLIASYENSQQLKDLTVPPNCGGWGRVHHFRRRGISGWPENPLPIDPASRFLGLEPMDEMEVEVFQIGVCAWRCWYCFVDRKLVSGGSSHMKLMSVDELLDLYLKEPTRPNVIDLSGGQPELVPEWVLWFAEALEKRGLSRDVYLWSDDSLSNDYLSRYLTPADVRRMTRFSNYGKVGCFKGFDEDSFCFNTAADPKAFRLQFEVMKRIVDMGLDAYGYATFTCSSDKGLASRMRSFVDRLQEHVHPLFPLRTVPLKILPFSPVILNSRPDRERALELQEDAVGVWTEELAARFPPEVRAMRVYEHKLK